MNKSVERTIEILKFFADAHNSGAGISQISREFDIPKSSASDVLYSLCELGFLQFENESMKTFKLGNAALRFGLSALAQYDLIRIARPEMERLRTRFRHTVLLGVESGDRMTFVEKLEGQSAIRLADGVGTDKPLHLTSIGKVLLAGHTDDEILDILGDTCYEVHTANSIVNPHQLFKEIEKVRLNGYAVENFEENDYIYSIAAPLYDRDNRVCAGICISMFSKDIHEEQLSEIAEAVKISAAHISALLGKH